MRRPIDEIAAELAGHGLHAHDWALTLIRALDSDELLTDAQRWRRTRDVLDAMDLVMRLRAGPWAD